MKKFRIALLVFVLVVAGMALAGCFSTEEKASLNDDNNAKLLGSTTVVISEVYYDTTGTDSIEEFVELYNKTASAITVGGWTLTDNVGTWTIPSGTSIPANSYITIARDSAGFNALFGKTPTVSGMTLDLGNSGDQLTLKNGTTSIDFVAWESYVSGWTVYANTSYSIQRTTVTTDTDVNADWKSNAAPTPTGSTSGGGTTGTMKIHYIDVGQADCIVVQAPTGETMMIDAGNNDTTTESKIRTYLSANGITRINTVVATHPHADHIGSLDYVINNYGVTKSYDSGYAYTSTIYTDYKNACTAKGVSVTAARRGSYFMLGAIRCDILSPTSTIVSAPANVNDVSVVLKLTYGSTAFLMQGDAPQFVEQEIMNAYDVNCDIIKIGHHGSYSASLPAYIDEATPTKGAVIMCGEGNSYGHPHTETLTTLNARSIPIYRTDQDGAMNGNFMATSNGTTVTIASH